MQRVSPAGTTTLMVAPGKPTKLVDWVVNWLVSVLTTLFRTGPQLWTVRAAAGRTGAIMVSTAAAAANRVREICFVLMPMSFLGMIENPAMAERRFRLS